MSRSRLGVAVALGSSWLALLYGCTGDDGVTPVSTSATTTKSGSSAGGHASNGGSGQGGSGTGGTSQGGNGGTGQGGSGPKDPGALVDVSMTSTVGVLLDDLPAAMRDRVAAAMLAKDEAFWVARAKRQVALTSYRLNFRAAYYDAKDAKQQLPLPPPSVRAYAIAKDKDGKLARRATIGGHDLVVADYTLTSTIFTDADSPGVSEPALASVGGAWDEPFTLPVDPELLLQRTGFACMDEAEFPPNSVDSEDVEFFYDSTCQVEPQLTPSGCHGTVLATESCLDALDKRIGKIETKIHFARAAWDADKAAKVRVGDIKNTKGIDLDVNVDELGVNYVTYRWIPKDSCSIVEGCVGGQGWRRLLQFNASAKNLGTEALNIGDVDYYIDSDAGTPNSNHHIYEYSACHHHYHFSHYGTFAYGGQNGGKRAFCLESVQRYSNHEESPTHNPYSTCSFQGMEKGWGDQYNAGIECQWVDVTGVDTKSGPVTKALEFHSNPDGFLCEGKPVVDAQGNPVWEPTDFKTAAGETVDRPKCDFMPKWDADNVGQAATELPKDGEGLVTSACARGQLGSKRNCGLAYEGSVRSCTPGEKVVLSCSIDAGAEPHTVRVCEASAVLGSGLACVAADALGIGEVDASGAVDVAFTCPAARDATEPGGSYSLYTGPLFPEDAAKTVSCKPKG
jgi:hypothetical protein